MMPKRPAAGVEGKLPVPVVVGGIVDRLRLGIERLNSAEMTMSGADVGMAASV